jgi:hypothetical protein
MKSFFRKLFFHWLLIFFEPKKHLTGPSGVGISTLLCHRDLQMGICSLMSFMYQLGYGLPVYVVDDGSLTGDDKNLLRKYFEVSLEDVTRREKRAQVAYRRFPALRSFRFDTSAAKNRLKLDAWFLHPFSRVLYLDADILFLSRPTEIDSWLKTKYRTFFYSICHRYMRKFVSDKTQQAYSSFRKLLFTFDGSTMDPFFCSGLLGFSVMNDEILGKLDSKLKLLSEFGFSRDWLAEETACALWFGELHATQLPPSKYLNIWLQKQYDERYRFNPTSLHYSGDLKSLYSRDAIRLVFASHFFR